jgi:ATP-dependent DNA helicase DinG
MLVPIFDGIAFSEMDTVKKAALLERTRQLSAAIADLTDGIKETSVWDPVDNREGLEEVQNIARQLVSDVETMEDMLPVAQAASAVVSTSAGFLDISTEEYCCFVEIGRKQHVLKGVPLDIGPDLIDTVYSRFDTTILTSATLTVADEFDFFRSRLGAWDAISKSFGSPFDYSSQAILSIPDNLPPHNSHEDLAMAAWGWGKRLAERLNGRTLMLFTSYRNLKLVKQIAAKELHILRDFRESSRAIILGTSSFWEGVDLPGSMLQAVVIDRLPFASPGHPLIRARMDLIEKHGGSSFGQYSLPLAAVRLRQGVGRLIRSLDDTGVVMIMDRRILTKNYGSVFLRSIPPFRLVSESQVMDFVMEHCSASGVSSIKGSKEKQDEDK